MKRWIALLLSVALTLSMAACGAKQDEETDIPTEERPITEDSTLPTESTTEESAEAQLPPEAAYSALLEDYAAIIHYRLSDDFEESWPDGLAMSSALQNAIGDSDELKYRWSNMIVELPNSEEARDFAYYGFIFHDLNADGTPEMFWVRMDHSILAIFTCMEGQVVLLDAYWSRYRGFITQEGQIFTMGSSGAADSSFRFLSLSEQGQLEATQGFYSSSDTGEVTFHEFTQDGTTQITEEAFYDLIEAHPLESAPFWEEFPIYILF